MRRLCARGSLAAAGLPAVWHLLQRRDPAAAAFVPVSACSALAAQPGAGQARALAWQGALVLAGPDAAAPSAHVLAWDTAARVHVSTSPGQASLQLPAAPQPWQLVQLQGARVAAVPSALQLGGRPGPACRAAAGLLISLPAAGTPQGSHAGSLRLLGSPAEVPGQAWQPGRDSTCTAALAAGCGASASFVQVSGCAAIPAPCWLQRGAASAGSASHLRAPQQLGMPHGLSSCEATPGTAGGAGI